MTKVNIHKKNQYMAGYASVFNNVDSENDIITEGAFKNNICNIKSLPLLLEHNRTKQIGCISDVCEDAYGLYVQFVIPNQCAICQNLLTLIKSGILKGLSIGYEVCKYYYDKSSNIRYITDLKLHEISLVKIPSNPKSVILSQL